MGPEAPYHSLSGDKECTVKVFASLTRAFCTGLCSRPLLLAWHGERKDGASPLTAAITRKIGTFLGLTIMLLFLHAVHLEHLQGAWRGVSYNAGTYEIALRIVIFVFSLAFLFTVIAYFAMDCSDIRFIWDCRQLGVWLDDISPGVYELSDLQDKCQERLVGMAEQVLRNGDDGAKIMHPITTVLMNEMKQAQAVMRRFKLTDDDWQIIFAAARARLDKTPEEKASDLRDEEQSAIC